LCPYQFTFFSKQLRIEAENGRGLANAEDSIFLHGEGPRSRCNGRTAALRLFVQPYDEDEQFFIKFYK
jgi:hypothetical protein